MPYIYIYIHRTDEHGFEERIGARSPLRAESRKRLRENSVLFKTCMAKTQPQIAKGAARKKGHA